MYFVLPSWTSFYITMYNNTDDVCVSSCRLTWINTMASTASAVTLMTACSRQGLHTVSPHTLKENICAHIRIRSFIVVSALLVRNTKIDYRIIWTQNISRWAESQWFLVMSKKQHTHLPMKILRHLGKLNSILILIQPLWLIWNMIL